MGEQSAEHTPSPLAVPIESLVAEKASLSVADAELLTRLARFEQIGMDDGTLGNAMDMAFMRPHRTAAIVSRREELPDQESAAFIKALRLAREADHSGIAYRLTENSNLTWMVPLSDQARAAVRSDIIFTERQHHYQQDGLYAPWYRFMQSRLIVCVARLAAGKPLEHARPSRVLQRWQALRNEQDLSADVE